MGRLTRYGCDHRGRPMGLAWHPRVLREREKARRSAIRHRRAQRLRELALAEAAELDALLAADAGGELEAALEPPFARPSDPGDEAWSEWVDIGDPDLDRAEHDPVGDDDESEFQLDDLETVHVRAAPAAADYSRFIAAMKAKRAPAAPAARALEPALSPEECGRCGIPGRKGCAHQAPYQAEYVPPLPDSRARPRGAYR